ncbi:MAG: hypothetical protein QXT14_03085 [Candidatus Bathyarchaeia archaeon]
MLTMLEVLHFILMGWLGAFLYVLIWAKSWQDLKKFESVRHMVVGLIVGYVYQILHSNYSWPDLFCSMIAGYFGSDFIQALVEMFRGKLIKKSEEGS